MGLGAIIPVCMVEGTTFAQSAEGNIERLTLVTAKSNTLLEEPRRSGVARRVRKAPLRPELLTVPSLRPPTHVVNKYSTLIAPSTFSYLQPNRSFIVSILQRCLQWSYSDFNFLATAYCGERKRAWFLLASNVYLTDHFQTPPGRVLSSTDRINSIHAFSSSAILGIVLWAGLEVRHVARKRNVAAAILSRLLIGDFRLCFPYYRVRKFDPPRDPAGEMEAVFLNLLER
ncbi:hypothetical protein FB446DRAFT_795423 [Lentinula raphanica]|nr:hypothetical protein FB446DRAFT_795423 [Lentinula raphanica]